MPQLCFSLTFTVNEKYNCDIIRHLIVLHYYGLFTLDNHTLTNLKIVSHRAVAMFYEVQRWRGWGGKGDKGLGETF